MIEVSLLSSVLNRFKSSLCLHIALPKRVDEVHAAVRVFAEIR